MNRIFYFCLCAFTMVFVGCKQNNGTGKLSPDLVNNPATADGKPDIENVPVFQFESDNHEFGEIKQGDVVSFNFKFKNIGKTPLIVSSASASCGCTVPEYSKDPVLAGQEGFIKVTFNSEGKHGMVSKTVTLLANTIPNTKVLTISADIQTKEEN